MHTKRYMLDLAYGNPLARKWASERIRSTINVIYYHWVGNYADYYSPFYRGCTLDRFRDDLRFFKSLFEIVPLENFLNDGTSDRPQLAITFDDGFDLERLGVTEVLADQQVKATTFVITSCIDNADLMWRNKLCVIMERVPATIVGKNYNELMLKVGYRQVRSPTEILDSSLDWEMHRKDALARELWEMCELPKLEEYLDEHRPYFSWDGLHRWQKAGHSVGLHTHTHPLCSRLGEQEIGREIVEPSHLLRRELGMNTLLFSYPFGKRLPARLEAQAVQDAGLGAALGISGFSPRHTPPRQWERHCAETSPADWRSLGRAAIRSLMNRGFARDWSTLGSSGVKAVTSARAR